jgi:hypothetical protein
MGPEWIALRPFFFGTGLGKRYQRGFFEHEADDGC